MGRFTKAKFSYFMKGLVVLFALLFSVYFTTCETPMGMGDSIDWEPPVLTLEPVPPNPLYVKKGTKISGKVTDNIGVDRIILRDSTTGATISTVPFSGNRWEMTFNFSEDRNGDKLLLEIVAFDKAGNTGSSSIATITIIVDIRPPIINDIWIDRASTRKAYLKEYKDITALEITDPYGEKSENGNEYQNGHFHIAGEISEEETRIELVSLNIYDTRYPNTALLELPLPNNVSAFSPKWLIKEEEIIAAGESRWPGYENDYYNLNKRFYYRVAIIAQDKSKNDSQSLIVEDEDYFCMWQKGDVPKGILDPLVGTTVTRGATFPVIFFDDDVLDWAYTGIFTKEQWEGASDVYAGGVKIPQYPNDPESNNKKLLWLKQRLVDSSGSIYDWNYDKHSSTPELITEQLEGKSVEEKITYLQTGNNDDDFGDFFLFSLTSDKKLDPHDLTYSGSQETLKPRWSGYVWEVSVVDENKPLIVFDTVNTNEFGYDAVKHLGSISNEPIEAARTGNSPEESTFPTLDENDGRYFEINGYTLRATITGAVITNKVEKFRMAWIPFGMPDGADSYVVEVQNALSATQYPTIGNVDLGGRSMNDLEGLGIQHWDFVSTGKLINGTPQTIGDSVFTKQVFRKKFDILGEDNDDIKGAAYKNFRYNGNLENEQKLFVVYAEDNMGHVVFRQIRLLPNKKPPTLAVYDISDLLAMNEGTGLNAGKYYLQNTANTLFIPNVNDRPSGQVDPVYDAALRDYNRGTPPLNTPVYTALKNAAGNPGDERKAIPFQTYTRGTTLKYWVKAEKSGDLAIKTISMKDVTSEIEKTVGSDYNVSDRALSFIEYYPDETTREFLFTATDTLGNEAELKRIVSITNTALLESITTTEQSGSYGIGREIILQANFSGQVRISSLSGTRRPELNIRYPVISSVSGAEYYNGVYYKYESIPCEPVTGSGSTLFLRFKFTVPEGSNGKLETMYLGLSNKTGDDAKPIRLETNGTAFATITDIARDRPAYVPGYTTGTSSHPNWTTVLNSLQNVKTITLDGVRPVITSVTLSGKDPYENTTDYYFKTDETISLTFTSSENIKPSANVAPHLRYYIRLQNNNNTPTQYTDYGPFDTAFQYVRPAGSSSLVFSLPVNPANFTGANGANNVDGELVRVSLINASAIYGTIEDEVGNGVTDTRLNDILDEYLATTRIYIKKSKPPEPKFTLNGTSNDQLGESMYYNSPPYLNINDSTTANNQLRGWEGGKQYSLNGGLKWVNNDVEEPGGTAWIASTIGGILTNRFHILSGTWSLQTRYVDRAGNISDPSSLPIQVKNTFPRLIAINADQPNGWHLGGENLSFTLNFEEGVRIYNAATVSITLKNRAENTLFWHEQEVTALQSQESNNVYSQSITLQWNNISGKEMRNGLYVSDITLTGLRDRFGNQGGTGSAAYTGADETGSAASIAISSQTDPCPNMTQGFRIDAIEPLISAHSPTETDGVANTFAGASDYRNVITLTFDEAVQKGSGTITIKPKADFLVPPVFEDSGYYLDYTTNEKATVQAEVLGKTIWVPGFYDIYNDSALDAMDGVGVNATHYRNYLTKSTTAASQAASPTSGRPSSIDDNTNPSMTRLVLDERTGQAVGPYVKTTHGLKAGLGYSGNYEGTYSTGNPRPEVNGPHTVTGYTSNVDSGDGTFAAMVPDTSTKWVLAYSNGIHDTTSAIANIRKTLVRAKFRWQEIEVGWENVKIDGTVGGTGTTVTITLNEPLLKGLQWDLSYPAGTFTDLAGNPAGVKTEGSYTFWSEGVQKPVIRVDRKSYDARTSNWWVPRDNNNDARNYTYTEPTNGSGWGINDFNRVNFRIESETPGVTIKYGITGRRNSIGNTDAGAFNSVTVNAATTNQAAGTGGAADHTGIAGNIWSGSIPATSSGAYALTTWNVLYTDGRNTRDNFWVRPNLLRKFGGSGNYDTARNIQNVNGDQRRSAGYLSVIHSYNRDATLATDGIMTGLSVLTLDKTGPNLGYAADYVEFPATGTYTYSLEAGKSYVVATATRGTAESARGYEGVFRTLVILNNQRGDRGRQGANGQHANSIGKVLAEGSNNKAGTPSIAGFPLQDGAELGDSRFAKMMYNVDEHNSGTNKTTGKRFLWVSTEIVCEFYFIYFGNGGNQMRTGDVNNYLMVRYGDLTFGNQVDRFPEGN